MIRFALDRGIHVIPKSVTPSRIESNSQVFDFKLTSDEIQQIKERVPIKESDTFNDIIEIKRPIKIPLFMKFHLDDFYIVTIIVRVKNIPVNITRWLTELCEINPYVTIFLKYENSAIFMLDLN